jgi:membrane-associated protease RseP (regulator of RpoE activity)
MNNFYQRFRSEIAAGGAVDETQNPQATRQGGFMGLIMVGLLVYLLFINPWTFLFVAGLLVSVFLHEVGHFVTARLTGMKATQFFMGFGPRVFSRTRGEVEYGVRALPLGAFVRIIGMNNLDEVEPADEPRAYRSKSYSRRLLVITAGSLMHMVIAFALFFGVYVTAGREQATGVATIRSVDEAASPAFNIGLREGDTILSIGGQPITGYASVSAAIQQYRPNDRVDVVVLRDNQNVTLPVELTTNPSDASRAYLGISADDWRWTTLNPFEATVRSVADIGSTMYNSVRGVVIALNPMNSIRHLTGSPDATIETRPTTVVGISQVGGLIGDSDGLKGVFILLASVNVFVGVFNMFPLLPFDGGHAAIATYERLRSRKNRVYQADISKMVPVATTVVGLLMILLVTGLYLDITSPLG